MEHPEDQTRAKSTYPLIGGLRLAFWNHPLSADPVGLHWAIIAAPLYVLRWIWREFVG
jgi:hypothetical protein